MGAGYGMVVYALLTRGSFAYFALAVGLLATAGAILNRFRREGLAAALLLIGLTLLVGYRAVAIRSAMNASFFVLILLVAALLTDPRTTTMLFAAQFGYIIVCASLGIFSWSQTRDAATGLYYANTVTVLVPTLIVVYLVAYVISKILIGAVEEQTRQADLLRKTQEHLVAHERLASARILAGGIAHDFNNILVTLSGSLDLLRIDLGTADPRMRLVEEAQLAVTRARDLISQLLMLSKGTPPGKSLISVATVVRETVEMTLRGTSSRAELDLAADLWPIEADLTQIAQVLQNLVLNAAEAMPRGGTVRVAARNREIDPKDSDTLKRGPYVLISITDHGIGIPPNIIRRVFDPFYSTKDGGTGLGLSICYSVVGNHHGCIEVSSVPASGTTFDVYLPARPGARLESRPRMEPRGARERSGRVLVVDDDRAVQTILVRMLERLGFRADAASEGVEGARMYKAALERGQPYTFAIIDLTIPGGIGGIDALSLLREYDPDVRAVVSSGYSSELLEESYEEKGFRAVLKKPYTLAEVARVADRILAGDTSDDLELMQ
jgi:signal transduction histidine kinase/CheY-like chemotaxis protein